MGKPCFGAKETKDLGVKHLLKSRLPEFLDLRLLSKSPAPHYLATANI